MWTTSVVDDKTYIFRAHRALQVQDKKKSNDTCRMEKNIVYILCFNRMGELDRFDMAWMKKKVCWPNEVLTNFWAVRLERKPRTLATHTHACKGLWDTCEEWCMASWGWVARAPSPLCFVHTCVRTKVETRAFSDSFSLFAKWKLSNIYTHVAKFFYVLSSLPCCRLCGARLDSKFRCSLNRYRPCNPP